MDVQFRVEFCVLSRFSLDFLIIFQVDIKTLDIMVTNPVIFQNPIHGQ